MTSPSIAAGTSISVRAAPHSREFRDRRSGDGGLRKVSRDIDEDVTRSGPCARQSSLVPPATYLIPEDQVTLQRLSDILDNTYCEAVIEDQGDIYVDMGVETCPTSTPVRQN